MVKSKQGLRHLVEQAFRRGSKKRSARGPVVVLSLVATLIAVAGSAAFGAGETDTAELVMPRYDAEGKLLLPEDYRGWIFVGSSLGLSYSEGELSHEMFHHTLMEPGAYRHYAEHREFRDGTMMVLMLHGTGQGVLPSRQGRFAAEIHGVEMAVKDSRHPVEGSATGWAYYGFGGMAGIRDRAEAFPSSACHSCHLEHAEQDNVFVQFYPLLREAASAAAGADSGYGATSNRSARQTAPSPEAERPSENSAADNSSYGENSEENNPAEEESSPQGQAGARLALAGLDPVLLSAEREELGKPEIVATFDGYRYQFVSEPTRSRFAAEPKRFSIQNETCLVVPGAPANPELFAVHNGRIYVFATPGCVADFRADPTSYLASSEEVP